MLKILIDGDEVNANISIDAKMEKMWYPLSPHFNIMGDVSVAGISGNLWIPKPVVGTMSNWLGSKNEYIDQERINRMENLPFVTTIE